MKRILFLGTILILLIQGCNSSTKNRKKDIKAIGIEKFEFAEWSKEVTLEKDSLLISFTYTPANESEWNKHEKLSTASPLEVTYQEDTTTIEFFKFQWSDCPIIGNISHVNDSILLHFCNLCPPNKEVFVEENELFRFTYKILTPAQNEQIKYLIQEKNLKR